MKFECGDLEQALRTPELMPEAREHLKYCSECRKEYHLWTQITSAARTLHEDWETPELWPKIRTSLEAETRPSPSIWKRWPVWALAAALVVGSVITPVIWHRAQTPATATKAAADEDFLTEQALAEVEKNEAAYRHSIDNLSRLAQAKLPKPAPSYLANQQEKLLAIDSAIAETRANVKLNRFNVHLQTTLADLYREKQQTLQELLSREQKN